MGQSGVSTLAVVRTVHASAVCLFFPAVWIVFFLYWQVKARSTKTAQRLEPVASRVARSIAFVIASALLLLPHISLRWLYRTLLPQGQVSFLAGAALTTAGLLFAVWARAYLGTHWSRSVTIKQDHQLIVTGPYA